MRSKFEFNWVDGDTFSRDEYRIYRNKVSASEKRREQISRYDKEIAKLKKEESKLRASLKKYLDEIIEIETYNFFKKMDIERISTSIKKLQEKKDKLDPYGILTTKSYGFRKYKKGVNDSDIRELIISDSAASAKFYDDMNAGEVYLCRNTDGLLITLNTYDRVIESIKDINEQITILKEQQDRLNGRPYQKQYEMYRVERELTEISNKISELETSRNKCIVYFTSKSTINISRYDIYPDEVPFGKTLNECFGPNGTGILHGVKL